MGNFCFARQRPGKPQGKLPCRIISVCPRANLKVLKSPGGPFHKGECSVCGETFTVSPREEDFKREMVEQFDAHLQLRHPRQWEFEVKKGLKRTHGSW